MAQTVQILEEVRVANGPAVSRDVAIEVDVVDFVDVVVANNTAPGQQVNLIAGAADLADVLFIQVTGLLAGEKVTLRFSDGVTPDVTVDVSDTLILRGDAIALVAPNPASLDEVWIENANPQDLGFKLLLGRASV